MRILWHSNAPFAPTGYGIQTALFTKMLAERHEVAISCNYGLESAPIVWENIPLLPGLGGSHGNETIPGHVQSHIGNPRDGLLITLYDTPVFDPKLFAKLNVACWTPVDHDPVPPRVVTFLRESSAIPVAMSRFGQEQLAEFDALYVPHATTYEPTPSNVREQMGVPKDAFLVTAVVANKGSRPSRKAFQQMLQAFGELRKRHDDAYLYLHTILAPEYADGEDILGLMAALGLPEESIKLPNQYRMMFAPMSQSGMAKVLTASDVLLNCSMGEGFGVPIIDAQACGTPVIATRHSAMSELIGSGLLVGGKPFWTHQASWMIVPDVDEMVDALEVYYEVADHEVDQKAVEFAKNYEARHVYEAHWISALEEIQERFGDREPLSVAA
jgi:hypothetical protein